MDKPTAPSAEIPFPEELTHLSDITALLQEALETSKAEAQSQGDEYREQQQYMADYRNEIDPKEIFQARRFLQDIERAGRFAIKEQVRFEKLLDSPYFARIDFSSDENPDPKAYYIGKFSFTHQRKILIFDWRAPVSSMFYDCELGKASYTAPRGEIAGQLLRKRQFKIKEGRMDYALESSMQIQDDVLQKELSTTSDEKMKTIIATLQREQNQIVRDEHSSTVIIQGVAGSGKTSIALHRVAYLLYRFKQDLTAQNVVILSPNKVFGDFIAGVLPELGEDPVFDMSFWDIADIQLTGIMDCEPDRDPLEDNDPAWCERTRFKSTLEFTHQLNSYLEQAADEIFVPADYVYSHFSVPADWIAGRYRAYRRYPILERISQIADDIYDRFLDRNLRQEPPPKRRSVLSAVRAMLKVKNPLALYKGFYQSLGRTKLFVMPKKHTLEWADVYPFLYVLDVFSGLQKNRLIKHVVIDEMQDYTPIQYQVINRLFTCKKTILGDFGQCVNPHHLATLEDLCSLYPGDTLVELNKSYRSSYEIISFAKRIAHTVKLEPVERHGPEPATLPCKDYADLLLQLRAQVEVFKKGPHNSLGIILKTATDARRLYEDLGQGEDLHLLTPETQHFEGGITISSVRMSKGLEFDAVMIPFADSSTYHDSYDRNLLYIACTRAMHQLTLLHVGGLTRLVEQW